MLAMVVTLGCQQNENDSERIKGMLNRLGYGFTQNNREADLIIYNTCCVRENAELKLLGNIGSLVHLKKEKPELVIGVCGCMMQQPHIVDMIKKKYKHIDIIFGTHTLHKLPELLSIHRKDTVVDIEEDCKEIIEHLPIMRRSAVKALVTVMYGCNNFCSYCIVPYVRGRERSRQPQDILAEIVQAASNGCVEVMLLGQNVNSYGNGELDFSELLKRVNEVKGIKRIRFMTSHPKDINPKLIQTIAQCENVCKQLHLPLQSGSNRILELMNRKYTIERYFDIIEQAKSAIAGITLSSDIIVGFPGETDQDFEQTLEAVKKVEFDNLFTFIYSRRKGTPAEKMPDVLTDQQKQANFEKLLGVQNAISLKKNLQYVGTIEQVLVEGYSKNNANAVTGRTGGGKIVNFEGQMINQIVDVEIVEAATWSLTGVLR